jgi:hypothetical protein
MQGYLKQMRPNKVASDLHFKIDILDSNTIHLSYFNNKTNECLYKHNFTKDQLLFDDFSDSKIVDPHRLILVATREGFKKPSIIDVFKYTWYSKAKTGGFMLDQFNLTYPLMYFTVPYIDSPWEDWCFITSGSKITIDNKEQLNTVDTNKQLHILDDIIKLLPTITINYNNGLVEIQLSEKKSNIEIYLETTTGILEQNRIITNSLGQAKTKLLLGTKGKIKAGFKFYSGKTEIVID